ncbi:uncharacterized protein LOC128346197 [Hemicordylus capensis]|uniref:uncharacterized protein LOC128346197 n=1 Tax=Hemicordylus capensis TaxID=884348 RepID=UPI002303EBF5|nr:uncharacterized protein LOC128346197 [Hemicordylus capensis]
MTRGAKRTKLMQGFTDRLEVLEAAMVAPASSKTPERPSAGIAASGETPEGSSGSSAAAAGSAVVDASGEQAGQGGTKPPGRRAKILVLGHSFIFWALKWAQGTDPGTQLGLGHWATIEWRERRGMRRAQLLPMLREYLEQNPAPDILLFHFGRNDLVSQSGISLARQTEQDLAVVLSWCPGAVVLWSDITQRRVWRGALKQNKVDRARRGGQCGDSPLSGSQWRRMYTTRRHRLLAARPLPGQRCPLVHHGHEVLFRRPQAGIGNSDFRFVGCGSLRWTNARCGRYSVVRKC